MSCPPAITLFSLALLLAATRAESPEALAVERARVQARDPESFAPVADDPALPRVLLIGDSISIGYTLPARRLLQGTANVHRIPENGGPTTRGLQQLDAWLGDRRWDVIHFNFGLHDVALVNDGGPRTPLAAYAQNLRELTTRLRATGARLVFATTTPVPARVASGPPRRDADVAACNDVARVVMRELGVPVNDLYAFAIGRLSEIQQSENVHFTPVGYQALAESVAASVRGQLPPAADAASADRTLDIGSRRQVFVDGRFLELAKGVALVVHRPQKTGAPVLVPDHPQYTAAGGYAAVLHVDGAYHLWYMAATGVDGEYGAGATNEEGKYISRSYVCYARSADGIRWEKPRLQLAREFPRAEPNIVLGYGAGGYREDAPALGAVFLDPHAPAAERLRMVVSAEVTPGVNHIKLDILSSPDGVYWRRTHDTVMTHTARHDQLDTQNVIFWDDRLGRYVAYVRRNLMFPWGRSRAVTRTESADLARFPLVEEQPVVLAWDALDPAHRAAAAEPVRLVDYYNSAALKYPWAQDAYYLFPSAYFHYESGHLWEFRERAPRNAGALDIRLAASRDGIRWERFDRRAFVPLGPRGAWDGKKLYMSCGIVPGADETELYLYYGGSDRPHGWPRTEQDHAMMRAAGVGPRTSLSGIGRLVIRRDGFISAQAAYTGGEFTTPPLRFTGSELVLNVDTSAAGEVRVEILDELHATIPGFTLEEADRIHTSNETNRRVTWRGRADVAPLAGRPVRLRFVMRDADLYAFQFRSGDSPR